MKRLLLTAIAILGASAAYSQVGIGTRTPNNSSQLEVTVDGQPEKRGILIPRVALLSTNRMEPIVNTGTLPNSLLVFNTTDSGTVPLGVSPGFYYWYDNQWHKMVSNSDDINTTNVSLTQDGQNLVLTDSDGNSVRIALSDLQKITTLVNNNDGTYTYTNEAETQVTINVPADVISNFQNIISNSSVLNQLITNLTNTSVGGNVYYDGTSFTYVDNTGTSHTINIQDIVRGNETVTTLVNNNDGTYTYTNEAGTQVIINVPADVISNFQNIISNSSVLNQLITNLTNTTVGGNVYYDGTSFTYVDNTGTSHTINIQDIVQANETITTLVDNNNGTYTYTSENGTVTTIDVPADVIQNFQDIMNDNSVSTIAKNIIDANETLTVLGYDPATKKLTYKDEDGLTTILDMSQLVAGNETVTTLVNNNDGTYTYTNETGTQVTINVPADVISNFQNIISNSSVLNQLVTNLTNTTVGGNVSYNGTNFTYVDNTGTTQTINIQDIVRGNETITTLVDNNNGTYTYTSENGTVTTIDVPADVIQNFQDIMNDNSVSTIVKNIIDANETLTVLGYDPATKKLTYKDEDGLTTILDMSQLVAGNETVTTLVNNNNGTYTYTNEAGTQVTINVPADVISNFQNIISNSSVLNQLVTNLTNTTVGGNVSYNGTNFTYVDNTGTTQTINIQDIVRGNETITTLVDNNNGTYTYKSEDGTVTTIDVPADVIQNFQDIMNDNSVSTIVKNIIDANETLTVLGYDPATKKLTYKDEDGLTTILDMSQLVTGNETVTTLVNNNNGTYTYSNEAGAQVIINVPADVISNFQNIISNSSVLNQLVTNLTNTTVGGNVSYNGTNFTYVDNTGTTQTINIQDIVRGNETITTLVDNNNGTYTYKSEDGTVTTIDVPADVIQNFQDIMNDNSVSTIVKNIIDANETLTVLGYDATTKKLTYKDENGNTTMLDLGQLVAGNETVTTLVNNNNGTYTYTNEAGAQVTINVPADVISNFQNIISNSSVLNQLITNLTNTTVGGNVSYNGTNFTYVDNTGTTQTINIQDIVQANETVTTLVDNNNGTYTYKSEDGTVTTIDVPADVIQNFQDIMNDNSVSTIVKNIIDANETLTILGYDSATKKLTYKDENGNTTLLDMSQLVTGNETVTTLVDNNNGTYTYKSENGTITTIDVPADVIQNFQDIMNDNSVSTIVKNIIDANETLTILGYDSATKKLTYKDENGNTTTLDMAQLVTGNETVTTLVNNNDGTYTYTNEAGTQITIDVPADVVSNFNDIISNSSVLNQLITNLTNTSVGGNVYYDGTSFTYVDNTGTSHTINIQDIVQANQKLVTLSNGTNTTIASTTSGNTTDYKVNVNPATATTTGAVKAGAGLDVAADGTLTVNVNTIPNATDKTATVAAGTNTSVITNNANPNNPVYTVNVPTANGTALGVVKEANTAPTINIAADGTLSVNTTALQNNQNTSSVVAGTATTVTSAVVGNNTAYAVNVSPATASTTGAVKPGTGLSVAADGTLSVNTTGTGLGRALTTDGIIQVNSANSLANSVLVDAALSIANNSITTVKIADDAVTVAKIANAGNNQVLTTDATGAPIWINQSTLVTATTNTLVNNGTNTLTSTVNGITATAPAVNTVATTLSGSSLTTVVNGVSSTALDLAPVVAANDKTSSVVNGTTTTVTSTTSGNNTAYTVEINPSSVQSSQKTTSVTGSGLATVTSSVIGNNTAYNVDVTAGNIQSNQKLTTLSNGTNTTVASTVTGNTTDYKVSVPTATASNLGVVKEASSNPTIKINSSGELSVNLSGTGTPTDPGAGKDFTSTDLDITNGSGATLTAVTANIKDGAVTSAKILDGTIVNADIAGSTITVGKLANAGNNQVLTTNASGTPIWADQSTLITANQRNTTVTSGTYTTLATTTPNANTTNYQVDVSPTALAGAGLKLNTLTGRIDVDINTIPNASDKTATVAAGTNTTVTTNTTDPNNPIYTVNVATANGTALGVVKQANTNPTVNIAPDGTLSVNTTATGLGKTLTTDGIIRVNSANSLANSVLADAALSIASNSITTAQIANGAVTAAKMANAGNNQVLTTDLTGAPVWIDRSAFFPATTNALFNNGVNTLTSTVNGVSATAATVNTVATTLSGSSLTTVVNGVSSTALNLTPVVAANDKTATVTAGTNTTVTNSVSGNTTNYVVNVPTANGTSLGVVKEANTAPTINIAADGTLSVNTTALQNNQKTSSVVAGTATTVTSAVTGNNTAYTVNVSPATASTTGAVKPGTGLSVAADGTLSVNTTGTGLGRTLTTDGIIQVNSASSLANSVLADAALSIANNSITTAKIADDAVTVAKIANAGNNQVLTTDATGVPTWVNKNTLDNIYTADGTLASNRIVNTNGNILRFRTTTPETRETIFNYTNGAYLTNATTTGRSNFRVSSGGSIVDLFQDLNSRAQLTSSGTSTGLIVGTSNGSVTPLEFITNGTSRMHISPAGKVGIGTTNMLGTTNANVLLAVNGSIETANSTYADYVFEDYFNGTSELKKDYTFKSIKEVEEFINENKHLPGITSIKDLRKNDKGEYIFNMSELSIQMLEKVEELYLHTIEQQKQLEAKDKEIDQLKESAKSMDERLKQLEKIVLGQNK